jgi:probable rRNA maturation factor
VSSRLQVLNRQRGWPVDCPLLRKITRALLIDSLHIHSFELEISIVDALEMTRLNETFLRHQGSTDVLAFDYSEPAHQPNLFGEIFVCIDEAVLQAKRFRTAWQSELVRYVAHGLLHLIGYDDHSSANRRRMKRQENRLLRQLAERFNIELLRAAARRSSQKNRGKKQK